jgi:hypothetical protein
MNTSHDRLTKKLRDLSARHEHLKEQYKDNMYLLTPQKEVLSEMLTSMLDPLKEKYNRLKVQLKESMNKTIELEKTLTGKTTDANKLIQLSKEISNRFDLE